MSRAQQITGLLIICLVGLGLAIGIHVAMPAIAEAVGGICCAGATP